MKTYRKHYCERRHTSYRTLATCLWPRAHRISDGGPYAFIFWGYRKTDRMVQLSDTREEAEELLANHARWDCRGCRHEIVFLVPPEDAEPSERLTLSDWKNR